MARRHSSDRVGLVVGKFAPLHRGHQHLIERAQTGTDRLVVAVYDTPGFRPHVETRARWVRELFPSAHVLTLDDPEPQGTEEDVSAAYADHFRCHHEGPVTHVYSSESYGERFARHLGAEHVMVDSERRTVSVTATQVRSDPFEHRTFLHPIVYRDLVVKVCFVGAESTGKTTLAEALARRYETAWMPEYGRELFELKKGRLVFDDLLTIAREHLGREGDLVALSNRFLFCDTNAIVTEFWSRFYFDAVDPALEHLADEVAGDYAYVLCGTDIPWVQDGWRETGGGSMWLEHQATVRADLKARGLAYFEACGPLNARVESVSQWLEAAFPPLKQKPAT